MKIVIHLLHIHSENIFVILQPNVMYIYSTMLFLISHVSEDLRSHGKVTLCILKSSGGNSICVARITSS